MDEVDSLLLFDRLISSLWTPSNERDSLLIELCSWDICAVHLQAIEGVNKEQEKGGSLTSEDYLETEDKVFPSSIEVNWHHYLSILDLRLGFNFSPLEEDRW